MLIDPVEIDSIGAIGVALPEAHDRTLAELLFNLADGNVEGFGAFLEVIERHAVSFARRHSASALRERRRLNSRNSGVGGSRIEYRCGG